MTFEIPCQQCRHLRQIPRPDQNFNHLAAVDRIPVTLPYRCCQLFILPEAYPVFYPIEGIGNRIARARGLNLRRFIKDRSRARVFANVPRHPVDRLGYLRIGIIGQGKGFIVHQRAQLGMVGGTCHVGSMLCPNVDRFKVEYLYIWGTCGRVLQSTTTYSAQREVNAHFRYARSRAAREKEAKTLRKTKI